jgi:hypothetical protein
MYFKIINCEDEDLVLFELTLRELVISQETEDARQPLCVYR